jgi:hypothetical protein
MEYEQGPNVDATAPVVATQAQHPSTVEDLERRLAVLKTAGVREYQDGGIHVLFERPPRKEEMSEIDILMAAAERERVAAGG